MRVSTELEHKKFVSEYKRSHKILNLQIKQKYLTAIMSGRKLTETREIRPTTEAKYIVRDADNYAIEDKERYILVEEPIEVEVRKTDDGYAVVYNGDESEELLPIYKTKDENGVEFEAVKIEGKEFECARAKYEDGGVATDENGLPLYAVIQVEKLHSCVPIKYDAINFYIGNVPNTDHALVEVTGAHTEFFVDDDDKPIWYEYNGERYYAEQVVYDLGEILCCYNAPKGNGTKI